jgi:hypothetical protein
MRYLNRLVWALAVVVATAATGSAQQGSVITQGGQTVGGNLGGTGGLTGGSAGQLGGQGGQGGAGGQFSGTTLETLDAPPQITAVTSTGSGLAAGNILSGWYADPRYQGSTWELSKSALPGGFGAALYGTGTGTGAGGRTGTQAGRLGGLGTQGRLGQNANQSGMVVPMQVQIAYPAVPRFAVAPMAAPQIQADVSGMFARSTSLVPGAANVQAIANGSEVTLRGSVADVDEARLIEGMARLTPGVRSVKNELTFPVQR